MTGSSGIFFRFSLLQSWREFFISVKKEAKIGKHDRNATVTGSVNAVVSVDV